MKKILALTVCTALLASLAAGCAKAPSSTAASTPASGTASAPASSDSYFPLKEQKTIKIVGVRADTGVPFAETEYFKELEKQTNVKVEWIDWPTSIQKEKQNLMFAGGQLPDAFYGSWVFLTKEDVLKFGSEGSLKDMTEFFTPEIMPNYTKLLEDVPELRPSLSTAEGQVYALSTLDMNTTNMTNDIMAINSDWLKAVNKQVPTTIDELEDVLKAFKAAGDLNGNGKADEIPMTFRYNDGNNGLFSLMGFTGIPIQSRNTRMILKDGVPVFHPASEEYKEYLTYLNKLNSQGLIDPEAFTMDSPTYNAKTQAAEPVAGVISTWTPEALNKAVDGDKFDTSKDGTYVLVPPLKGKDGVEPKWQKRITPLNGNLSFGISAKSENAELVARWIDLAFDTKTSINNYIGVKGLSIEIDENNAITRLTKPDGSNFVSEDLYPLVPNKYAVAFLKPGDYTRTDNVESVQNKIACDKFYEKYLDYEVVEEYGYAKVEENQRISEILPDMLDYVDQMSAQFVTKGGIEEGWDKYVDQLKKLKMEEYESIKKDIHTRATAK